MTFSEKVENAANFIRDRIPRPFDTLLILGSGFRGLADSFKPYKSMKFQSIPHMPTASAPGHESNFYFSNGISEAVQYRHLAVMAGRFHFYEGFDFEEICFPIFVFKKLGIKKLILTNASGGLSKKTEVGKAVRIDDFLGLFSNFSFQKKNKKTKRQTKTILKETITYAFMPGPNFGTAAEYRTLQRLDVDLVGMSTYPEMLAANKLALKVAAFSVPVCSYYGQEDMREPTEEEVIAASEQALPDVLKMINTIEWT